MRQASSVMIWPPSPIPVCIKNFVNMITKKVMLRTLTSKVGKNG